MDWARILAYITGTADQELLLRNEYLVAENRILRAQIKSRLLLSDADKKTLADIGHRLGRKALGAALLERRSPTSFQGIEQGFPSPFYDFCCCPSCSFLQ